MEPQAREVMGHMLQTYQVNPQWAAAQQGTTAQVAQITTNSNREISNIITGGYWQRQGVQDEMGRRRSNATLGVVDVTDPNTGTQYKVESGSNYYWID